MGHIVTALRTGYTRDGDTGFYPSRLNASDKYTVQVPWSGPVTRGVATESILAARYIREQTTREITVLYSGGLDSEWALESFLRAGVKVTALLVEYEHGLNEHDMVWARRYLKPREQYFNVEVVKLDLEKWYSSDMMYQIASAVRTPELAYTAQFGAMLERNVMDTFFVTGYDEPLVVATDTDDGRKWELVYDERHNSVTNLFNYFNLNGLTNWSRATPELLGAFMTQPQWQMLVANLYNPLVWNSEMVKTQMYQSHFPTLLPRTKYTGFEKANRFIVSAAKRWQKELLMPYNQEWRCDIRQVWDDIGFTKNGRRP